MSELTAAEALARTDAGNGDTPPAPSFELKVVPNRVFGEGRRCCVPGCITILSRYNGALDCFVHQDQRIARQRGLAAEARRAA